MALALHPTQGRVILHSVTWATFERLLADRGDHAGVRIAYDQGTMELAMPSAEHETVKQFLVLIVDAIADAGIPGYLRTVRGLRSAGAHSVTETRCDMVQMEKAMNAECTVTFKGEGCSVRKREDERYRPRSAFTVCSQPCLDQGAQQKLRALHDPRRRALLASE